MFVAAGALIGAISVGGAYLFGATLIASMLVGASIGALFETANISLEMQSPTYSFGPVSNSKSQMLPIPIIYGTVRVAGNIFYENYLNDEKSKVSRMVGISEGPVQSITGVLADDQSPDDLEDSSYTVHLNTTPETTDPRDPSEGARPYPDNIAFVGVTLKAQQKLTGPGIITAIVEGRTVWTPSGVAFSRNPAWIVRDFLTNTRYGLAIPESNIDDDSFLVAANYCDALVDGAPRFTLDFVIDTQRDGSDILVNMLSCFRAYILKREKISLKIDAPVVAAYKAIGEGEIVQGSFTWWQTPDDEMLNRVVIEWVDPDNHWESTTTIFEADTDIATRGVIERSFSLRGITNAGQAARMGAFLLDSARSVKYHCSFNLSLGDADIEVGDVIAVSHEMGGWVDKWFRVVSVTDNGQRNSEEITVICSEYVASIYGDRAEPMPEHVDTNFDNPYSCPDVTGLTATEVIQTMTDGTVASNVDVTWVLPTATLKAVEVSILEEGASVYRVLALLPPAETGYVARNICADQSVTIRVTCITPSGIRSVGATKGLTLYGKALPPGVPSNLAVIAGAELVRIQWTNPSDADLSHVEVLEYKGTAEPSSPTQGTAVGSLAGSSLTRGGLDAEQTYWYWIRAVDTSGNVSDWVGPVGATTTSAGVSPGSITETEIADDAISTPKLKANAVTAAKINVDSLSAIKADLGTVTAGVAKSSDGRFEIDLTNKTLKIYDADDVLRVKLGYLG